jgi:hypothetical protein
MGFTPYLAPIAFASPFELRFEHALNFVRVPTLRHFLRAPGHPCQRHWPP